MEKIFKNRPLRKNKGFSLQGKFIKNILDHIDLIQIDLLTNWMIQGELKHLLDNQWLPHSYSLPRHLICNHVTIR